VRSRIRGGTLTPLEVTVELQRIEELRQDVRVRKDLEVETMHAVIRRQQLLAPFYRSEPAVFRPAVFPAQLLQDSITLQQQAVSIGLDCTAAVCIFLTLRALVLVWCWW
jgi:hypothetical protein